MACLLCAGLGCSPSDQPALAPVRGVVTLDGKPLGNKEVRFSPEKGGRTSGAITKENGEYELRYTMAINGAIIGTHKVTISTPWDENQAKWKETVPVKYNVKSELTAEVKNTKNKIDFALVSD